MSLHIHRLNRRQFHMLLMWTSFALFTVDLILVVLLKDVMPPPLYYQLEALSGPLSRWAGFTGALVTVFERVFTL